MRVLDVGCAKGFLVKDLHDSLPGLEASASTSRDYALMHCEPEVVGRLHLGNAEKLPFPDGSFDCVICAQHDPQSPARAAPSTALREIQRLSGGRAFVQVDTYRTPEQKAVFESWVLTAEFHDYPDGWVAAVPRGRLHRRLLLDDHRVALSRRRPSN